MDTDPITITQAEMEAAFTEWHSDCRKCKAEGTPMRDWPDDLDEVGRVSAESFRLYLAKVRKSA